MRLTYKASFAIVVACAVMTGLATLGRANDTRSGDWTIRHSDEPGKVEFSLMEHRHGGNSNHESDWPKTSFPGIDFSKPGRQDARFTVTRDAGTISCEGFLDNGEGAGIFHF
jgi:hypothetical protein